MVVTFQDGPHWSPPASIYTLVESSPTLHLCWSLWPVEYCRKVGASPLMLGPKKPLWLLPSLPLWITCSWEACCHVVKILSVERGHRENVTSELDLGNRMLHAPSLSLECTFCPLFPQWEQVQGRSPDRVRYCWDCVHDWTPLRPCT